MDLNKQWSISDTTKLREKTKPYTQKKDAASATNG
jgi:hypothetical protein